MSNIPSELRYVSSHEWIRLESDGTAVIGVTDHAQEQLGDVVFVELPDLGANLSASDDAGVVESVKAASDIYAPISGEVVAVNEALEDEPELVNSDPYGDGWFFKVKLTNEEEINELLDAEGYAELCESEE
ncbi:glycine cleavage system protein GcvH [Endozoicomonas sp. SM1973]|uniref:Glycine cleavage system H protein n=1 Tax=Spartinivicinus marinus TaxID=2994442 RepID=A0A853HY58_9GAMM|nr:glycine cleavage system protein GcvH [Spartinivicinus marinus]MCX4027145.1 glycine cleavage system protein GcvH [Spartinivicinus marinus]NYZ66133.1 glycine cleavage system protein GcvH [Spartinivicinus marinus]